MLDFLPSYPRNHGIASAASSAWRNSKDELVGHVGDHSLFDLTKVFTKH